MSVPIDKIIIPTPKYSDTRVYVYTNCKYRLSRRHNYDYNYNYNYLEWEGHK